MGTRIEIIKPQISRSTATLMQTGQYISYATGDDGDLHYFTGRETDFLNLLEPNPFGETFRFSDEFGGTFYNNGIVIDWSTYNGTTVLGWQRNPQGPTDWSTAIANALSFSIGGFAAGTWRVANINEYMSICNFGLNTCLNYYPLNINNAAYFHTSTTYAQGTTNALKYFYTGQFFADPKANNALALYCRTFTVTGTTLT